MIEGSTNDGQPLVQVSAQVMTRDDSTGGWVPLGGGGLSRVRLCKLIPVSPASVIVDSNCGSNKHNNSSSSGHTAGIGQSQQQQHSQQQQQQQQLSPDADTFSKLKPEYIILGQRFADNEVILHCSLKSDIQYTKANPKWHHWKTDEKRFGLSFERSEDAKSFEEAIRDAVADLMEGMHDDIARLDGDDRIFQCMELPLVRKDSSSHSASTTSTTTSSPGTNSPQSPLNNNDPFSFQHTKHLHRMHYLNQRVPVRNGSGGGSSNNNNNGLTSQHHYQQQQHHQQHHHQTLIFQHKQNQQQHQAQLNLHPVSQQILHHQDPQQFYYHQQHHPSSPCSEKSSVHKSSFDSSSGHEDIWVRSGYHHLPQQPEPSSLSGKSDQGLLDNDGSGRGADPEHRDLYKDQSYVVFSKSKAGAPPHDHDYSYPNLEPAQKPPAQRSSTKKQALPSGHRSSPSYPPLPMKNKPRSKGGGGMLSGDAAGSSRPGSGSGGNGSSGTRSLLVSSQVQCKHCREVFSVDENVRGSCEDAPDSAERCIEYVSCVTCFSCLMYHCLADADGEYLHPCSCDSGDPNHCKRWTALSFLSLLFPCLWCYPPLKACHYCGTQCGLCGGRHKAA